MARLASVFAAMESRERRIDAGKYRWLVLQLTETLKLAPPNQDLEAALVALPAAAVVCENMRYEMAGLCRSSLERSLESECQAAAVIQRAKGCT